MLLSLLLRESSGFILHVLAAAGHQANDLCREK
jgi:hypothetical protein